MSARDPAGAMKRAAAIRVAWTIRASQIPRRSNRCLLRRCDSDLASPPSAVSHAYIVNVPNQKKGRAPDPALNSTTED
jgi:hypothetical protein